MVNLDKIRKAIQPVLDSNDIKESTLRFLPGNPPVLELALQRKEGNVDLDFCEKISKEVSDILDEADDSADSYMLDVCSFGAERVLETEEQIAAQLGNYVHVELINPQKGIDTLEGYLEAFADKQLTIAYMEKTFKRKAQISLDNIRLIRLAVKL